MFSFSKRFFIVLFFSLFLCAPTFASTISRPLFNNGLIGYWSFEDGVGSSKANDRSGFGNTGNLTNMDTTSAWVNGATTTGQALDFDGSDDMITTTLSYNNPTIYTISIWFKTTTASGHKLIGLESNQTGTGSASYDRHLYMGTDSKIHFGWTPSVLASTNTLNDGKWHHAVATHNGATGILYVDGVRQTSGNNAHSSSYTGWWRMGGYKLQTWSFGTDGYYTGQLDEARVYNRALSADEVSRLYKLQKPKVTGGVSNTGLVGYWPLDGGSGTRAEDASVNNNTGTLTNGPTWTSGKNGKAVSFDGWDDYIEVSNDSTFSLLTSTSEMTLSAWIKTSALNASIISMRDGGGNPVFDLQIGHDGVDNTGTGIPSFIVRDDGGGGLSHIHGPPAINDDNWHHVVAVRTSGKVLKLYVDGLDKATGADTMTSGLTFTDVRIGDESANAGITNFLGKIDDVRIYSRALSATEVSSLYKGSKASVVNKSKSDRMTNGLTRYYTFDGNKISGALAVDSSQNESTGTITNGPVATLGKVGQALSFDGTNDYVSIPNNAIMGNIPVAISVWFKTSATNGVILGYEDNAYPASPTSYVPVLYIGTDGKLYGEFWNGAVSPMVTGAAVNDNNWHHVVLAATSATSQTMYVDGVSVGTLTGTINHLTMQYNQIGVGYTSTWTNVGSGWNFFQGKIDDVRFFNRAVTADEVKALYNMGK